MKPSRAEKAKPTVEAAIAETSELPGKRSIPLSRPIEAHGETVKELVFREPTGADIARCGVPVKFDFTGAAPDILFDAPKMTAMLATLAEVPPSSIGKLSATDWTTCAWAISDFFVPDLKALSRTLTG